VVVVGKAPDLVSEADNKRNEMTLLHQIRTRLQTFWDDQVGASLVEYALLVALIALVAVVAVRFFGGELSQEYTDIANSFP